MIAKDLKIKIGSNRSFGLVPLSNGAVEIDKKIKVF
tara:strand:- start:2075 stop:2182 length:108 start_codon:yes stop_codon:yes gene_type:complete